MGFSPLHASTVGLILNPKTNRISPQFHCVYDDYFETVHNNTYQPTPIWEDLIINQQFRNDIEGEINDNWESTNETTTSTTQKQPELTLETPPWEKTNETPVPATADSLPAPVNKSPKPEFDEVQTQPIAATLPTSDDNNVESPRRSTRVKKSVERFTFDKAHGYTSIRRYSNALITCLCYFHAVRTIHDVNYLTALAMDPEFGVLDMFSSLPPDILTRHPFMFKANKTADPDTPGIKEALTGEFRDDFVEGMGKEIEELEGHGTWTVIKREDIKETTRKDGTKYIPDVIPTTWAFKIK